MNPIAVCDRPGHSQITCAGCAADQLLTANVEWLAAMKARERVLIDARRALLADLLGALGMPDETETDHALAYARGLEAQLATLRATVAEGERDHYQIALLTTERDDGGRRIAELREALSGSEERARTNAVAWQEALAEVTALRATVDRAATAALPPHSPAELALLVELLDQERARIGTLAGHVGPVAGRVAAIKAARERLQGLLEQTGGGQ